MQFSNKATADKYAPLPNVVDRTVHQIGMYSGKLSDIPVEVADVIYEKGTNLFELKPPPAPAKPEPAKPEAKKEEAKPGGSKN